MARRVWQCVQVLMVVCIVMGGLQPPPEASGQTALIPGTARATPMPGVRPFDIGVGADGTPFAIDDAGVHRWTGTAWQNLGMGGRKVDVGPVGPYIVTASNEIWYRPAEGWRRVGGFGASNLAVGAGGHLWALGTVPGAGGFDVWYHLGGDSWEAAPGQNAVAIDVAPDGTPWIVNDAQNIFRRVDGQWQSIPGKGLDISVGADGAVWVLDGSEVNPANGAFSLKRWTGTGWERADQYGATAVAARDASGVFSVNAESNVYLLTIEGPQTAQTQAPAPAVQQQATGTAVINILCKYGDNAAEPRAPQWVQDMFTRPGRNMESYWKEVSFGIVNFTGTQTKGWYTVKPKSAYTKSDPMVDDCIAAADPDVHFPSFSHIVVWYNGDLPEAVNASGVSTTGLTNQRSLDGETRLYAWSLLSSGAMDVSSGPILVLHELGHTFWMDHSRSPGYDVESGPYCRDGSGSRDEFGCWRGGPNAVNRERAKWIPANRTFNYQGGTQRVPLKHLSEPGAEGFIVARVPIGATGRYYTVESRKFAGVDVALPAAGVVIHEVDEKRDEWAHIKPVREQPDGTVAFADLVWQAGQAYTDEANNLSIRVEQHTDQGAEVTIGPR